MHTMSLFGPASMLKQGRKEKAQEIVVLHCIVASRVLLPDSKLVRAQV